MTILYIIIAIVCWGITPILEKIALRNLSPAEGVLLRSLMVVIFASVMIAVTRQYGGLRVFNWKAIAIVMAGGLISAAFGQLAYFHALKAGRASIVVPMCASYPLVTLLLSVGLLGESLTVWRVLGAALVVGGVALVKVG